MREVVRQVKEVVGEGKRQVRSSGVRLSSRLELNSEGRGDRANSFSFIPIQSSFKEYPKSKTSEKRYTT